METLSPKNFYGRSTLKNQRGSSLLLVLAMLMIVSIFAISFGNSIVGMQKGVANSNHKSSREFGYNQIINLLKIQNGLTESSSLPENSLLGVCLFGGVTSTCTENCCIHNAENGFYFVDPSDNTIAMNAKARLVGPPTSPIWYNSNNTQCLPSANKNECSYSLSGKFKPVCPGNQASCHHAEHLILNLKLTANPDAKDPNKNIKNKETEIIYYNKINYPPFVVPVGDMSIKIADGQKEITIMGDSGHPSEIQNFIFTKLVSSDPSIVSIVSPTTTPFSSGLALIKIQGLNVGTAKITVQINDGGLENNTSKDYSFMVGVVP